MNPTLFDAELIKRYEGAGPRYTSYPTAVQFQPGFRESYERIARSRRAAASVDPLSLYVHLPFCASPCFYCACNRVITRSADRAEAYLSRLHREIELQARLFHPERIVEQLHFGGGTPTYFSTPQLENLLSQLRTHFRLTDSPTREYSIEIDPRTVTPGAIGELAALGFNRMSLGVQDFDAAVQLAINRVQPEADTRSVVEAARAAGVGSVSFDLIYGLPHQIPSAFERTLTTVLQMRPDRLAVYAYAHLPAVFKAQRRLDTAALPSPSVRLELLHLAIDRLTSAGYVYVGMDHFALPSDELVRAQEAGTLQRNFQGYSTRALYDLVGLGVSAIGKVGSSYAQNYKLLPEYYATIDAGRVPVQRGIELTRDDEIRASVIQRLMCQDRVQFDEVEHSFGIKFVSYFRSELDELQRLVVDGLVTLGTDALTVTPRGRLLLRNVAMIFDAYLQARTSAPIYSRVI